VVAESKSYVISGVGRRQRGVSVVRAGGAGTGRILADALKRIAEEDPAASPSPPARLSSFTTASTTSDPGADSHRAGIRHHRFRHLPQDQFFDDMALASPRIVANPDLVDFCHAQLPALVRDAREGHSLSYPASTAGRLQDRRQFKFWRLTLDGGRRRFP